MAEWAGKQGNFMGCRVRTYCVMSNHFHILLEVPPAPEVGISDGLLLKRLAASYSEAFVDGVMQELESARKEGDEAVGGGKKGNGKKSREGIVRVCVSHEEAGFETDKWKEVLRIYRRAMGMPLERKNSNFKIQNSNKIGSAARMNDAENLEGVADRRQPLPELSMAKMLRCRVRYFTDGAVIGSKEFVNEAFAGARERFTERRKDGARRMRGSGAPVAGTLWSMRDLRLGV